MNHIFLDTVGLLSIWDKRDQWHDAAERAFTGILRAKLPVITTSFVLLECGNAAARRPYKQAVDRLRQQLEKNDALIIPTSTDWESAWEMYRDTSPGQPGIVDLISFSVMRRLGIHTVFSNDAHFQRAGFEIVF